MTEEWRTAPGFPAYAVSNLGRIKRLAVPHAKNFNPAERLLSPRNAEVCLQGRWVQLARLILEAFVCAPPFPDAKARHLDDDRRNNHLTNLAWGSQKDNVLDAARNGLLVGRAQASKEVLSQAQLGRKHSEATRLKMSRSGRARMASRKAAGIIQKAPAGLNFTGRRHTDEWRRAAAARVLGKIHITDGVSNKMVDPSSEPIPSGWREGITR